MIFVPDLRESSMKSSENQNYGDLDRFYSCITELAKLPHQGSRLATCTGGMPWPKRGVYFVCEPGELRIKPERASRVVRVGTHAITEGSKGNLWSRIRIHRGSTAGGNHRGSVFRKHLGFALLKRSGQGSSTWGVGSSAPPELKASKSLKVAESDHEKLVSGYMGDLTLYWIDVPDEPSPSSDRAYIERNAIAMLSNQCSPIDPASSGWLGNNSRTPEVRNSGLWNVHHVYEKYDPSFLVKLDEYIRRTADNG